MARSQNFDEFRFSINMAYQFLLKLKLKRFRPIIKYSILGDSQKCQVFLEVQNEKSKTNLNTGGTNIKPPLFAQVWTTESSLPLDLFFKFMQIVFSVSRGHLCSARLLNDTFFKVFCSNI